MLKLRFGVFFIGLKLVKMILVREKVLSVFINDFVWMKINLVFEVGVLIVVIDGLVKVGSLV